MELTKTAIRIKKLAGALGIIQGAVFTVLSLAGIVIYYAFIVIIQPTTYIETVGHSVYTLFFSFVGEMFMGQILISGVFHGFMWVYLVLDVIWIGLSIHMLRKNDTSSLAAWGSFTLLVSAWDMVTFILLGVDYNRCLLHARHNATWVIEERMQLESICANGILTVLVVAAKGFTLWIFNFVLSIVLIKVSVEI